MQTVKISVKGAGSLEVRNKTAEEVMDAITEQLSVKDFSWDKIKRGPKKRPVALSGDSETTGGD